MDYKLKQEVTSQMVYIEMNLDYYYHHGVGEEMEGGGHLLFY